MPLFRRNEEPDTRSLIAYLVARAREKGITLNQTKLVKLLYLIDVERIASMREPLTGLEWVFYHYGPYAFEIPDIIEEMERGNELVADEWNGAKLFRAAPGAPDGDDWPPATRRMVDTMVRRFAPLDLNELLDHVYFETAPMQGAVRGTPLEMSRVRTHPLPRRQAPLTAPRLDEGTRERVADALRRRREVLVPVADHERRPVFVDESDEPDTPPQRGRLVVPEDTEL